MTSGSSSRPKVDTSASRAGHCPAGSTSCRTDCTSSSRAAPESCPGRVADRPHVADLSRRTGRPRPCLCFGPWTTSVIAALAKWPDVPAVFGWLSLTARGQWRLRGEPIGNAAICEFIGRNYAGDERGRWYFQNGPQRVYVSLELTPWVYRLDTAGSITTHTGIAPTRCTGAALLDNDRVVLVTELGPGAIDDRDVSRFLRDVSDAAGRTLTRAAANVGCLGPTTPTSCLSDCRWKELRRDSSGSRPNCWSAAGSSCANRQKTQPSAQSAGLDGAPALA